MEMRFFNAIRALAEKSGRFDFAIWSHTSRGPRGPKGYDKEPKKRELLEDWIREIDETLGDAINFVRQSRTAGVQ